VSVVQHGKTIFTLSASFHREEPGVEHAEPMPDVPRPEELEPADVRYRRVFGPPAADDIRDSPIDIRHVGPLTIEAAADPALRTSRNRVWLRADGELPDDPLLHVCLMTYASDMSLLDSVQLATGQTFMDGSATGASLDHAMWFHRPFRADRWLLYAQDSPSASNARGLARGELYTEDGTLVVSVVQEGLIRRTRPAPAS
jgi:acyl-CoA thioesterase-2